MHRSRAKATQDRPLALERLVGRPFEWPPSVAAARKVPLPKERNGK